MNPKMILLVEDNPSDIDLTRRALSRGQVASELVVVEDGREALDYLFGSVENPLPALILLDLKLPKVDGLEVLSQIRANPRTQRLPVVILTTSKEDRDVARSYDLGANSYIQKPVDFVKFAETITSLGSYWLKINEPPPGRN